MLRAKVRGTDVAAIGGLTVLAAALRLPGIGANALWMDEAYSVLVASHPVGELPALLARDTGTPLYYALLHLWIAPFGNSEVAVRALSTLAGIALVPLVAIVGQKMVSPRAGLIAGLLAAVCPLHVFYSQQTRSYALLALGFMLVVAMTRRAVANPTAANLAGWVAATLVVLATHTYGVYILPACALVAVMSGALKRHPVRLGLAALSVAGVALLWVPVLRAQTGGHGVDWFREFWGKWGPVGALFQSVAAMTPAGDPPAYVGLRGLPFGIAGAATLLGGALAIAGGVMCARAYRRGDSDAWMVPVFCAVPIVCAIVASCIVTPHHLPGRTDLLILPAFVLLQAAGIDAIGSRALSSSVVGAMVVLASATIASHWTASSTDDRDLARALEAAAHPGDIVFSAAPMYASTRYYLARDGSSVPVRTLPRSAAEHPGWIDDREWATAEGTAMEASAFRAAIDSLPAGATAYVIGIQSEPLARTMAAAGEGRSWKWEPVGEYKQTGRGVPVVLLRLAR